MSDHWGKNISYTLFGESHGPGIGIVIDGLPVGIKLDFEAIKTEMDRRKPGQDAFSTPRKEGDDFEILSGYFNEKTTGTSLTALIRNKNTRSQDYAKLAQTIRPGHADYTGQVKYKGFQDFRGGGHFSGRLTAPLVFAGAVAKQILGQEGIEIGSILRRVGKITAPGFAQVEDFRCKIPNLRNLKLPHPDSDLCQQMAAEIETAKANNDSVGGIVETVVLNMPAGIGDPFFDSLESTLAQLIFSVPAVKGIEFGDGFEIASLRGSEANDAWRYEGDQIVTETNHNGGILGGISNGMPIVFRTAIKPTPSIGVVQKTIDIQAKENTELEIVGRHDPCIVPRAIPVLEAMAAIAILEGLILMKREQSL